MAISAKEPKIPLVLFPVSYSLLPSIMSMFRDFLFRFIYVVYIQTSNIRISTPRTSSSEFFNQGFPLFPLSKFSSQMIIIFVPISFATFIRTISHLRYFSACSALARPLFVPAIRKITSATTKFRYSIAPIFRTKCSRAIQTLFCFHNTILHNMSAIVNPEYCRMAEKRIGGVAYQMEMTT